MFASQIRLMAPAAGDEKRLSGGFGANVSVSVAQPDTVKTTCDPPRPAMNGVLAIAASFERSFAIVDPDRRLLGWGENMNGHLGVGDRLNKQVPTPVRKSSGAPTCNDD